MQNKWYALSYEKVLSSLESKKSGLSKVEAKLRIQKYGRNKLPEAKSPSNLQVFLSQFNNTLVYVLIAAGIITFILHERLDSFVIFLAVFINAIFGYWEERKTMKIMEKLNNTLTLYATVIRDGQKQEILQEDIVPGDIIEISAGDKVPADARLFHVENLRVSEAVLTGESVATDKTIDEVSEDTALADRTNMVFMGSLVESGSAKAVVVSTGSTTETGKIIVLMSESKEEESPLQKKVNKFGKQIALLITIGTVIIFIGGMLRGYEPIKIFEAAVAIAVGGIPESLPIIMTIVLVIGMDRILAKKGLIRKLTSVETLGSTSVICFDKTKTLTKGEMEVVDIKGDNKKEILKIATLTTEAYVENPDSEIENWKINGSSTGKALVYSAGQLGFFQNKLEVNSKEIIRVPFDSVHKYMISLRQEEDNKELYVLGAPERIFDIANDAEEWQVKSEKMMSKGLRVVCVAKKNIGNESIDSDNVFENIKELEIVGLIGLIDPIRDGIYDAVALTVSAGIRPVIITGDHALTARAIAKDVGIKVREDEAIEGRELDSLSDEELMKLIPKIKLYSRAEPKHKMRIVEAFQGAGEVVAMVGDGVNDAPAIKKADIGVSLGSGTEVAKEASDLVLLNDSFSIIVSSVEQGRVILDNLRKSVSYILSDSFSSMIIVGVSSIAFGWPIPILPVQILWNNFVEDTLPSIAYAFEPKEDGVMKRKPEPKETPLLTREMKALIFGAGLLDEFLTLLMFWYFWSYLDLGLDYSRTMVFGAMSIDTAFVVFGYKNLKKNIWNINIFSNKWLIVSSILVFFVFAIAIYVPLFNRLLHTVPLAFIDWVILIVAGIVSLGIVELTKFIYIKFFNDDI